MEIGIGIEIPESSTRKREREESRKG